MIVEFPVTVTNAHYDFSYKDKVLVAYPDDEKAFGPNIKGFRDLLSRGESAETSGFGMRTEVKQKTPFSLQTQQEYPYSASVYLPATGLPSSFDFTNVHNLSRADFRAKAFSGANTLGLATLGELRETVKLFQAAAERLSRSFREYYEKFAELRLKRRPEKEAVALYLEYVFGWQAMYLDVRGHWQNYQRRAEKPFRRVVANASSSYVAVDATTYGVPWAIIGIDYTTKWEVLLTSRTYGNIKAQLGYLGAMADFGLSLRAIPATVWELTPWSWAIDYITNLGDLITGIGYVSGNTLYSAELSYAEATSSIEVSGLTGTPASLMNLGDTKIVHSTFERVPEVDVGDLSLTYNVPSVGQVINAAAALYQLT